ncbi:MAG: lysylphosphatidylglycerol synthase transmembrane domain-containing protein, partial [Actinomycetes bacterium]
AAVGLYRLVSYWAVVAVGWIAWAALHEGPRLPARARAHLAVAGRLFLDGMAAATLAAPYTSVHSRAPAEVRRP